MTIAEESKKFHAENRGNCAMSVAYGYARATGKTETEALEIADKFNPSEQDSSLQPLRRTCGRGP